MHAEYNMEQVVNCQDLNCYFLNIVKLHVFLLSTVYTCIRFYLPGFKSGGLWPNVFNLMHTGISPKYD